MRRGYGALLAAGLALVTACGSTSVAAPPVTGTSTLIADATEALNTAGAYHLVITYSVGQATFKADLHITFPSDAVGWVSEDGVTVQVIQTGGSLYVQGTDFISEYGSAYYGRLFGDRWVLTAPGMLRSDVVDVSQLASIASAMLKIDFHGKRTDHVPAATESTAQLSGDFGAMYIMELPPHRLVKVETANGFVPVQGISSVSMEILDYNDPAPITAPAGFADPNSPATLPPRYELSGVPKNQNCDPTGCTVSGTVVNQGGTFAPAAPSTFTVSITRQNHTLIDKCSGTIPVVANGQTRAISCRVNGRGWQNFALYGGYFYYDLSVDNPSYDG